MRPVVIRIDSMSDYNNSMPITLRAAGHLDVPLLVQMNQELIEDEGSANPMTPIQLEQRMMRWLKHWQIDLFMQDNLVAGYCVYRMQSSDTDPQNTVFIRHYYISRELRRQGLGREAMKLLQQTRFPDHTRVYLEVLWHNQRGRDFWQALGFKPYSITMKLEP